MRKKATYPGLNLLRWGTWPHNSPLNHVVDDIAAQLIYSNWVLPIANRALVQNTQAIHAVSTSQSRFPLSNQFW